MHKKGLGDKKNRLKGKTEEQEEVMDNDGKPPVVNSKNKV